MPTNWLRDKKFWGLVCVGIGVAVLLSVGLPTKEWAATLNQWLKSLGIWTLPTFIAIYVIASVSGLPNVVFLLVAGSVFGLPKGIMWASVADTMGAVACFFLGRTLIRHQVQSWIKQNSQFVKIEQAVAKKGWKILLLSRLAPMIPSNILNYGFSLSEVKFWQYLVCTWVGMLPIVSFYVYIGYFGTNLLGGDTKLKMLVLQSVGLIIVFALAFYITHLVRKTISVSEETDS